MIIKTHYSCAVIGAGPAGIAAVVNLQKAGVPFGDILWVDEAFEVGDFWQHWRYVSSNTKVKLFQKFYEYCNCETLNVSNRPTFEIDSIDPEETCVLALAAEPLRWITQALRQKITAFVGKVSKLSLSVAQRPSEQKWKVSFKGGPVYTADKIVLATGSEPKQALFDDKQYPALKQLPLAVALGDPNLLKNQVSANDCIAVFGASHSAILILKNLLEIPGLRVINFYRSSLKYAVYHGDWIENDNTGLKGIAAEWAHAHLDQGQPLPDRLLRVLATEENIKKHLPLCTKAVYAVGFDQRKGLEISMPHLQHPRSCHLPDGQIQYDCHTGKIAPGLVGAGVAFPKYYVDRANHAEYRVGVWKFMEDAKSIVQTLGPVDISSLRP